MDRGVARAAVELLRQDAAVDAELVASAFDSPLDAAEALAYLCGFLVEMHARAVGAAASEVIDQLARHLDEG